MKKLLLFFLLILFGLSCKPKQNYDLIIKNATVLDVNTGKLLKNKSILILNGKIEEIVDLTENILGKEILDAKGKLVTPGLVDTHIHPTDIFGDYENAPKELPKDRLNTLRKELSNVYLPYGTTTVMTMGQPEKWVSSLLEWQKNSSKNEVDVYICGGALISKDNRIPYIGHTEVLSPKETKEKILEYKKLGINHLKLYYRLKEPEFSTAIKIADSLNMKIYGHIGDFNPEYMTIPTALQAGLTNFEHIAVIPNSIITSDADWELLNQHFNENFGELTTEARVMEFFLEQFRFIDLYKKNEMESFINQLAEKKCTFSTTLHRIYEQIQPTYYTKTFFTKQRLKELTPKQLERCKENFSILMKYLKIMNDKGIKIRLGSDMIRGGKVNISELIILGNYGFSVAEIFKIATLNGAYSIGLENEIGTIEKNKTANLIIWDQNPFEDIEHFKSDKTIIKNGYLLINNL